MVDLVVQLLNGNLCLQALEDEKLELSTAFLVVQEMIAHWPQVITYINNTSQRQVFQHVEGRVGIVCVELHVSNQMLMGFRCRVKHLIVKSLEIPISKLVWNCSKSSFKTIDYREAFKRSTVPSRDQGFFLCGQMCDFLHRLLRRIVSRSCLPAEWDWDALRSFDFALSEVLGIPEFMQKTEFRAKLLKVAKSKIDVERDRGKKGKSDVVAKAVMGESFNPFIDQGRQYIKYVAKELLKHPTFKSDLVVGLASFDYSVLFKLPKTVAIGCYQHLF